MGGLKVKKQLRVKSEELRVKDETDSELRRLTHAAIKRVTEEIESFKFNTAISALMEFRSAIEKASNAITSPAEGEAKQSPVVREAIQILVQLLNPIAPHFTEELWERLGHKEPLARSRWPGYDAALIQEKEVTLVVQVNGKVRSRLTAPVGLKDDELKTKALADPVIQKWLDGKSPRQVIVVPNRLINLVL